MNNNLKTKEVEIPKENAVFWMDERGRWCNQHGPFEHPKIIAYFHKSIRKDEKGYFVEQSRDGIREKVYFHHHDTPIFVVDALYQDPLILIMNTGMQLELDPRQLFQRNDQLYVNLGDGYAKFAERVLIRLSDWIEYEPQGMYFQRNGERVEIQEG